MSIISKQDTNGVKPLLQVGELGYDNYLAGGDKGRVYVGTGTENISMAKKMEVTAIDAKVNTHTAKVDNPHAVTKAQVGLGNADNTADINKNVLSATKLATARTINGVAFDGSANINIGANDITTGTLSVDRLPTVPNTKISGLGTASTRNVGTASGNVMEVGAFGWGGAETPALPSGDASTGEYWRREDIRGGWYWHSSDYGNITGMPSAYALVQVIRHINEVHITVYERPSGLIYTTSCGGNTITIVWWASIDSRTLQTSTGQSTTYPMTQKAVTDALDTTVKLTGNQTIAGIKTFSSSPIVPVPTTDFQSVPLKSTNITVNVGAGQTYTTINQALEYLSGFYPMYKKSGITATINLKAGFVMAEQVLVSGIDLGWITIVGEDAETIITHTALTTGFNGLGYPAFGVDKGGTSPMIGQLFRFNVEKVGGNKHGLTTHGAGSSADILNGKGFIGAGTYGIYAIYGSIINAGGANASNAGDYGVTAICSSIINASGATASNAGVAGIYARYSSTICAVNSVIQNQTTGVSSIRVADGSTIEATGINTTGGTVPALSQTANTLTGNGIIYQ